MVGNNLIGSLPLENKLGCNLVQLAKVFAGHIEASPGAGEELLVSPVGSLGIVPILWGNGT